MRYLWLLTVMYGCGDRSINVDPIDHQDPPFKMTFEERLKPYVSKFESEMGTNAQDVSTEFKEINDGQAVGQCWEFNTGEKKILIDPRYWDVATECEREELMYHELGHCALGLDHNENVIDMGDSQIPESIMYPYIFCPDKFRNYFIKELKTHVH